MPDPVAIPCERADALSGLSEAALECTLTGEVTAANALALDMFGVAAEELVGGPAARWLTVGPALEDLARGGSAARARIPLRGRRANGVPFPLRGSVSRLPDTGSGPRALWRLHELQRNELLGAAHRFFEAGFEHAPIGMGIFNSDGEYVHVNAELERILGRPAAELMGRRDQELTHPDDRSSDVEVAWRILAGELDTHRTEKRFVRPDGSVVWTIANLTFMRDEGGGPLMWVGFFQDITERRAAEEADRRRRELSQAIIDSMPDGFVLVREAEIVAVNEALCRITGFTREELLGARPPFPFWATERSHETLGLYERALEDGGGELELTLMRRGGEPFHASMSCSEAIAADGAALGFVATIRDISERKRHENELQRQATRDGLTGLLNRTAFLGRLRDAVAAAQAGGRPLTLALLDIDHFKAINDRHGHPVGDRVLVETTARLRGLVRAGDHLARVGGEEFAWILPGSNGDTALWAAERARRAIEESELGGVGRVTVSVGLCELADARDLEELYRLADVALYRAKALGRNRSVRHTPL